TVAPSAPPNSAATATRPRHPTSHVAQSDSTAVPSVANPAPATALVSHPLILPTVSAAAMHAAGANTAPLPSNSAASPVSWLDMVPGAAAPAQPRDPGALAPAAPEQPAAQVGLAAPDAPIPIAQRRVVLLPNTAAAPMAAALAGVLLSG